ncbi:hypothetical protein C8R45DRAFT_1115724 [Mycena sanguinolenta]|nr:hypothetical protein C8R45DRAFT_1115724 [Mycena sanguinolenta]
MSPTPLTNEDIVQVDWATLLLPIQTTTNLTNLEIKCQLVFSLLIFLNLSIRDFLIFLFESMIPEVKRVGQFMGYSDTKEYGPEHIFRGWHMRFPKSIPHLHSLVTRPCMREIVLQESDNIINNVGLKVRLKDCMIRCITDILNPGKLAAQYTDLALFSWEHLTVFTTSPNEWRKKRAQMGMDGEHNAPPESDEWEGTAAGMMDDGGEFGGETDASWRKIGFAHNATFVLIFVFSIMAFTRNSGTNLFSMILRLFLEIGSTSSRILNTLSNAGACVSITTIERLKEILSKDAVTYAIELMQGSGMFYLIFDNIFLRRSQQQLFNKNSIIHAMNAAAISLPDANIAAEYLTAKLENRGKCTQATGVDILPTANDEAKMASSFKGLVMILTLAYCPGSKQWENRDAILKAAREIMASDRPLLPKKTDAELQKNIKRWADLSKWKPLLEELREFTDEFVDTFALSRQAENAKDLKDNYYQHSCLSVRDALIFRVYEDGVSLADAGVVLCVLKYWAFSFRGAGLHNYARECLEMLLQWKYELTPTLQEAKEQAMFHNRWGLFARNIPANLYLEQNIFWVKRVHIAKGSGVTIKYIIKKGSACVEALRAVSHQFARTFGFTDCARHHKEVDVTQDL